MSTTISTKQILMQNRYFLRLFLFVLCLSTGSSLFSQTVGVNERGDSIVVFNDGSWRYFDSDIDSPKLQENQEVQLSDPKPLEVSSNKKPKEVKTKKVKTKKVKPKKAKSRKSKANKPKKNKPSSQKAKKPKQLKKSKKPRKNKKAVKYTGAKKRKSKKKNPPRFTDEQSQIYAEKAEKASINSQLRLREYEESSFNLSLMEGELKSAYTNPNTTDADIVDLETKVRSLREIDENAKLEYEMMRERSDFYKKLISLPIEKRAKFL